jgi:hypothetical protein
MNASANSPEMRFYAEAYGSCKFYQIDDGTRIVPISYPHLYRYRGKELKNLNRIEYFSILEVQADRSEKNDEELPHTQYTPGQKIKNL